MPQLLAWTVFDRSNGISPFAAVGAGSMALYAKLAGHVHVPATPCTGGGPAAAPAARQGHDPNPDGSSSMCMGHDMLALAPSPAGDARPTLGSARRPSNPKTRRGARLAPCSPQPPAPAGSSKKFWVSPGRGSSPHARPCSPEGPLPRDGRCWTPRTSRGRLLLGTLSSAPSAR